MSEKPVNIAREFGELTEDERINFVSETLDQLVTHSQSKAGVKKLVKWLAPLFTSAIKQPTPQDLTTISHFTTVFLYSMKEEFRYKWAKLLHNFYQLRTKKMVPQLANLPKREKEVNSLKWIHAGMNPQTYAKLNSYIIENDITSWDEAFNHLLTVNPNEKQETNIPKPRQNPRSNRDTKQTQPEKNTSKKTETTKTKT